jgi:hypothetical protein
MGTPTPWEYYKIPLFMLGLKNNEEIVRIWECRYSEEQI